MHQRLKSLIALWFVLQIVLPFTAPLQTCDLVDLFGTRHHSTPSTPESSAAVPESEANAFVSPLSVETLRASTSLAIVVTVATSGPMLSTFDLQPALHVRQTVLRV